MPSTRTATRPAAPFATSKCQGIPQPTPATRPDPAAACCTADATTTGTLPHCRRHRPRQRADSLYARSTQSPSHHRLARPPQTRLGRRLPPIRSRPPDRGRYLSTDEPQLGRSRSRRSAIRHRVTFEALVPILHCRVNALSGTPILQGLVPPLDSDPCVIPDSQVKRAAPGKGARRIERLSARRLNSRPKQTAIASAVLRAYASNLGAEHAKSPHGQQSGRSRWLATRLRHRTSQAVLPSASCALSRAVR
jgi:hypothetical protein